MEDLHYDLEHHAVSRFWASVACSCIAYRPYGGSIFAGRLKALEPETTGVVRGCPIFPIFLPREIELPKEDMVTLLHRCGFGRQGEEIQGEGEALLLVSDSSGGGP